MHWKRRAALKAPARKSFRVTEASLEQPDVEIRPEVETKKATR